MYIEKHQFSYSDHIQVLALYLYDDTVQKVSLQGVSDISENILKHENISLIRHVFR